MNPTLKEALKDSVKYPWHIVFATNTQLNGVTYCVKNSVGVKLFSVTKESHYVRAKKRVMSDYSMTIFSNPVVQLSGDAEKVDIEGIFHACETRMANPVAMISDRDFMADATIKFLKQNQK